MKSYTSKFMLQEYFQPVLTFQGYTIYDIEHSVKRFKERLKLPLFYYEKLLKKAILWLVKNKKDTIEDRYIFVSNKYNFGIQLDWRKDRKDNKFAGFTATTLSDKEMNFFKYDDKKIIIETLKHKGLPLTEAKKLIQNEIGYFRIKTPKILDKIGYSIFYENGKIYYTFNVVRL